MNLKKLARWCVENGLVAAGVYYGLVRGVDGAANVLMFWVWFAFVMSFFMLSDDVVRELQRKNGSPAVPLWINQVFDFAIVFALAWSAWWWSAAAFAIHSFLVARRYVTLPEKGSPKN